MVPSGRHAIATGVAVAGPYLLLLLPSMRTRYNSCVRRFCFRRLRPAAVRVMMMKVKMLMMMMAVMT